MQCASLETLDRESSGLWLCKLGGRSGRIKLRLVRVKVFLENRYFSEMLFSGKENVFMCLVTFQKMFQKIFSDVWLCSWKYQRKHIFYLLLTFSHIFSVTKRIHDIIHSLNHKQNPEKNHKIWTNKGEIAIAIAQIGTVPVMLARCRWSRGAGAIAISSFFLPLSLSLSLLFSKAGSHLKWK